MAKLINVIKDGDGELEKRQLPLMIDEKLTMVLDLIDVDFMCEYPKIRGKDKELFLRKFSMLCTMELKDAFRVSCKRLLDIVSDIVPCVGCRRSVERLFHQMKTGPGRSGLYPLVVTQEGVLILPEEVYKWPNVIGAMFHNHTAKLNQLSTTWSRSKKSSRCALHSLDAQRYVRPPLGSGWRALWECMVPFCKQEVATIDTSQLLSTLETYLQKHRFCTECRTKVMKAYSLLVDEPEECKSECGNDSHCSSFPCEKNCSTTESNGNLSVKEKGFIPSLYAGIRRCSPNNHIHVDQRTDYIMGLILAAEPELLGNRRERHAKTLEIAQEEVLVCVGLCLYERVHRIQLRLREEQTTCQLLALVAINALSTNFQLAVENKQGISQLELLFQEFSREDRLKQKRKQVKKLKKRRKKQRKNAAAAMNALQEINTQFSNDEEEKQDSDEEEIVKDDDDDDDDDDEEEEEEEEEENENENENGCSAKEGKANDSDDDCNMKSYFTIRNERIMKRVRNDLASKKEDSCYCSKYEGVNKKDRIKLKSPLTVDSRARFSDKGKKSTIYDSTRECSSGKNGRKHENKDAKLRTLCRPMNEFISDTHSNSSGSSNSIYSKYHSDKENANNNFISYNKSSSNNNDISNINASTNDAASCDCCSSIQIDCGYGSADNNNMSSSNGSGESSVDSSEVACSEGFCNHDGTEECNFELRDGGGDSNGVFKRSNSNYDHNKHSIVILDSASQSLEQMLTETSVERESNSNHRTGDCIIPVEEIQRYKSSMGRINEKRKQLRQTLKSRFAQLCLKQQCDVLPTS